MKWSQISVTFEERLASRGCICQHHAVGCASHRISCVVYDTNIIRKNNSMASLFGISICTDTYTPVLQFNYNTDKYGVTVSVSVQYMIPQSKEVSRN